MCSEQYCTVCPVTRQRCAARHNGARKPAYETLPASDMALLVRLLGLASISSDDRDPAIHFQDRPLDLCELLHANLVHFCKDFFRRHALTLEVALEELSVVYEDGGLPLDQVFDPRRAERR